MQNNTTIKHSKEETMNKQTAVEWLVEQVNADCLNSTFIRKELIDQAKAMEREQHSQTWDSAIDNYEERGHVFSRAWADFDDYYKEKFGGKNE